MRIEPSRREAISMDAKVQGLADYLFSMSALEDNEVIRSYYMMDAIEVITEMPHLLGLGEAQAFNDKYRGGVEA